MSTNLRGKQSISRRFMAVLLCLSMILSMISGVGPLPAFATDGASAVTNGVNRQADPSTMDTYREMLNFNESSRYAGRLWSDKTVFAYGQNDTGGGRSFANNVLTLTKQLDGVDGSIALDADFLEVFSALGSSQQVNEFPPVDLVLALDISGSMGSPEINEGSFWVNTADPGSHTGTDGLGYYQGKDSDGNDTTDGADDANYIPDKIVPVLPKDDGGYTVENITNGQMAFSFYKYNEYLAFCNSIVDALCEADDNKDGKIGEEEKSNVEQKLSEISNVDYYLPDEKRTIDNLNKIYTAYLEYRAIFERSTEQSPGDNLWLSDNETGRNAIWPCQEWKDAIEGIITNNEDSHPMLNAKQGPNRMYYVMQAANQFIEDFLALNGKNRISVVVYDAVATVLMPLAHYEKDSGKDFLSAKKHHWQSWGMGQWACTVSATAKPNIASALVKGEEDTSPFGNLKDGVYTAKVTSWANTNTEAAITAGLDILANSKDSFGDLEKRTPILVLMTDGAANTVLTGLEGDSFASPLDKKVESAWIKGAQTSTNSAGKAKYNEAEGLVLGEYNSEKTQRTYDLLTEGGFPDETTAGLTVYGAGAGHVYGSEENALTRYTVLLHTLMSAAYQKTLVEQHYNANAEYPTPEEGKADWTHSLIYTVGFGLEEYKQDLQAICEELLNPQEKFGKTDPVEGESPSYTAARENMYDHYSEWMKDSSGSVTINGYFAPSITTSFLTGNPSPVHVDANYDDTENLAKGKYFNFPIAGSDLNDTNVTKADIDRNIRYNEDYFTASIHDSGSGIDNSLLGAFNKILQGIRGKLFTPVAGSNDLGVDNAVTYKDPIGKYMEVKDVKNLVLFGNNIPLTKAAMYNYTFVSNHRTDGVGSFKAGWYHFDANGSWYGDAKETGWKSALEDNNCYRDSLTGDISPWKKLHDGSYWAYFVSSTTALQFVPTVASDNSLESLKTSNPDEYNKLVNTTYTFYRVDKDEAERQALHMNPAYGESAPPSTNYDKEGGHLNTPGVYALDDLRIWVEDTGDYSDSAGNTLTDTNYDEALYINLPVNMLPLRTVSISQGEGDQWTYATNLPEDPESVAPDSAESASFPLRVFYTVGMAEDILTSDRNINIAGGVSAEYIQDNKAKNAAWADARGLEESSVEFFSNWYNPENRYSDYATTSIDYSYGDPVLTFSPSTDNRYYIFQKPLALYNRALVWVPDKDLKLEANKQLSQELRKGGLWKIAKINEDYTFSETDGLPGEIFSPADFGGVVLADRLDVTLTDVDSEGANARKTNQMAIWSALSDRTDGTGLAKGTVVFLKSDLLTDVAKPDDGSPDPFSSDAYYYMAIEYYALGPDGTATPVQYALTRKGSEFGSAYQAAGIQNGDMLCWHDLNGIYEDQPYTSYSETNDSTRGNPKTRPDSPLTDGEWVVAAKPGGLRVGALAQAVGEKTQGDSTYTTYPAYKGERFPDKKELSVGYYGGNATRTANNYYMPTISTSSNAEKQDIVVNVYLGNNGRLWTSDTLLLLTKQLEDGSGRIIPESGKDFDFQVTIQGCSGSVSAVRVRWNEAANAWQRQIHYIDMELDGNRFLQNTDGTKAMVDSKGCRVVSGGAGYTYQEDCKAADGTEHTAGGTYSASDGGPFYVYINPADQDAVGGGNTALRVYHNPYCTESADQTVLQELIQVKYYEKKADGSETITDWKGGTLPGNATGKRDFYAANVRLVPVKQFEETGWDAGTGHSSTQTLSNFYLATLDPTGTAGGDIVISSPYRTQSAYLTQEVQFGIAEDTLYDKTPIPQVGNPAANTAQIKLRSGWGLLFAGMSSGTSYRLTENISKEDRAQGYNFLRVQHVNNATEQTYTAANQGFSDPPYSVRGYTGWFEDQAHFVNTYGPSKRETDPGDGKQVQIGKEIAYEISYYNITDDTVPIIIVDRLDPGVDFVSASDDGFYSYFADTGTVEYEMNGVKKEISVPAHTVAWVIKDVKPNTVGTVTLKVRVNENAKKSWQYGDEYLANVDTNDESNDYEVVNKAGVQVGNGPMILTDQVENSVAEKEESSPGDGKTVEVGQTVSYEISWRNATETAQKITVEDWLDEGVDFVSAEYKDVKLAEGTTSVISPSVQGGMPAKTVTITYDKSAHKVTWTIDKAEPGESGTVSMAVRVNDKAVKSWSYTEDTGGGASGNAAVDYKIINRAEVSIGNDHIVTNEVENPLQEKTETAPGSGKQVQVGDEITYEILYRNNTSQMADITIVDTLDPGVTVAYNSNDTALKISDSGRYFGQSGWNLESGDPIPAHSIVWILKNVAPGASGHVEFTVTVNEKAFENWQYGEEGTLNSGSGKDYEVVNKASIQVGNEEKHYTNVVANPIPEKTETMPGAGKVVSVGDTVTYEIGWRNVTETAQKITVEDWLDEGVDFVSAKYGYVELAAGATSVISPSVQGGMPAKTVTITYDKSAHKVTWTIENAEPGEMGTVVLNVQVNANAIKKWSYGESAGGSTSIEHELDCEIVNRAEVSIGNDHKVTPEVKNPVLAKTESNPGSGKQVQVGEQITYTITWSNYEAQPADVIVRDALDPGVDFRSASFGSITLNAPYYLNSDADVIYGIAPDVDVIYTDWIYTVGHDTNLLAEGDNVLICYDRFAHEITWYLYGVPAGYCGTVNLSAAVNENADRWYEYNSFGNIVPNPGGEEDHKVLNRGGVTVGNNPEYYTNIIKNPTCPTYQPKVSKQVIGEPKTMPTFCFTLTENAGNPIEGAVLPQNTTVSITRAGEKTFDEIAFTKAGTYTFTICETVPAPLPDGFTYDTSTWTLTVLVAEDSTGILTVTSASYSKDGVPSAGASASFTNTFKEPGGDPHKTETSPGDQLGVKVGQEITYKIDWVNWKAGTQTVTITDPLDKGVDFVSATNGGTYNTDTRTVTWTLRNIASGATGSVYLTVRVTARALEKADLTVYNQATVTIGNESKQTEIPENPVEPGGDPHKTETDPGNYLGVKVEDTITYRIDWVNWKAGTQTVMITDPLDYGVDFVSASDGGSCNGRTVTWNLGLKASGDSGSVYLTVRVTARALEKADLTVYNQATVTIGNESKQTEIPENPVEPGGDPHKAETDPGNYLGVKVGDTITYRIDWVNWQAGTHTVTITDPLDYGVDFVSASDGGTCNGQTVTWNLGAKASGDSGFVTLTVRVTARALEKADLTVYNQATVTVSNESKQTEIPENPVEPGGDPHKAETDPGNYLGVKVGDTITYRIDWVNWQAGTHTVTITDSLDYGVDFVSASDGGTCNGQTVTWNLGLKASGDSGSVYLTVRVTARALEKADLTVYNQATVTVGNESKQTEIPENPVEPGGDPHKIETNPGDQLGVKVGQEITYRIDWTNWSGKSAEVVIVDPLDEGVTFVSASHGGRYDAAAHSVLWNLGIHPAGVTGSVTLTVRVNEKALEKPDATVYNQAIVYVDNDSKWTEIPENPVEPGGDPHKEETAPGDGETVAVGQTITYRIEWTNWTGEAAAVTITDPLDTGVDFVSASDGGAYSAASHTVTWNLGDQNPGSSGSVTLTVQVNASALEKADKTVYNQAAVTAGNESKQTEIPANPVADGGTLTVSKILEGEKADPNKDWTFTVTLSDSTINGTYGGMEFTNGVAAFTLKGGESITAAGLPAGVTYTVTEAEANTAGYVTTSTGETGTIAAETEAKAEFVNSIEAGDLTVVKNIEGKEADPNKDWTFTVTLSDTSINGTYGGMTFTNGVATFTLKGGESLTATGLPAGITYTVTEAEANTDGYTTRSAGTAGTIPADGEAVATFVNSKGEAEEGDFAVRKRVRGEDADPNQEFHFVITLSDPTISGTYGDVTFENGVGYATLKNGQHVWILDLPVGVTYTVSEVEANADGYQTGTAGTSGTLASEGCPEARFTNYKGPGEPDWNEPWEDLPDPDVPLAPADPPDKPTDNPPDNPPDSPSDNPPQTSDQTPRELWMLMMAAAFLGMTVQFLPGKKKEET